MALCNDEPCILHGHHRTVFWRSGRSTAASVRGLFSITSFCLNIAYQFSPLSFSSSFPFHSIISTVFSIPVHYTIFLPLRIVFKSIRFSFILFGIPSLLTLSIHTILFILLLMYISKASNLPFFFPKVDVSGPCNRTLHRSLPLLPDPCLW